MKQAVIIGAGQTGRGFIAPIVKKNGYSITFLDKDEDVIHNLRNKGKYQIEYFAHVKQACCIDDYNAYTNMDEQAIEVIAQADVVFTSVFASHIKELIPMLKKAITKRSLKEKLQIVCCENGVHVKKPLVDAKLDAIIAEGIIFCTTLQKDPTSLSLLCEDYPELPIDHVKGLRLNMEGMPLENAFDSLIQRKIYTYNFMSAVVCYLGSYLSYEVYGDAANDPVIANCMKKIVPIISEIIAQRYQIPYEEQLAFTKRAVMKFQNKEIYDTIYRNARQVERKLQIDERLFVPLSLAHEYHTEQRYFEFVIVAALYYGISKEELNAEMILSQYQEQLSNALPIENMRKLLQSFIAKQDLSQMLENYFEE